MGRLDYNSSRRMRHRGVRRRGGIQGSMRLGALFAILVGINVYVFFFRGGTSIRDVLKTGALSKESVALHKPGKKAGADEAKQQPSQGINDDSLIVKGTMKGHLGLSSALAAMKIDGGQVTALIEALKPVLDMRSLRPRHRFTARLDPSTKRLRSFTYRISPITSVVARRRLDGSLSARRVERKLKTRVAKVGGVVRSSLGSAMSEAGEGASLVSRFIDLFSWDINWYNDPREGDQFRIVVEKQYLGDKLYRYGKILAAEYRGKLGRYQAFYFKPRGGKGRHYTPEGRSISREFLKTPLHFKRISSKFNSKRFHPVLHRTKGHFGVDYAAPNGTPVWAAADGTVTRIGRFGGAGNMVTLRHKHGRTTLYMHLSRFARGLKRGSKVSQRQVIGYVGATGLATGPHLHYGIKVGGRHVDPLHFNAGKGRLLSRSQRIRFLDELPRRMEQLERVPVERPGS